MAHERRFFHAVAFVALVAGLLAPFLPFLVPTSQARDSADPVPLIAAVFVLPAAGGGPFRGEAMLAGVVVAGYVVVLLAALIGLVVLWRRPSVRAARFTRRLATLLLVATGGAVLLLLALVLHFEGTVSIFSPAVIAIAVAAFFSRFASRIHPDVEGSTSRDGRF